MKSGDRRAIDWFILSFFLFCFSYPVEVHSQIPEKPKTIFAPKDDSIMNGKKSVQKNKELLRFRFPAL